MNALDQKTYYRVDLDDYATPSFITFTKDYYGALEDLNPLVNNERVPQDLRNVIRDSATSGGGTSGSPLLIPAQILRSEKILLENYSWEHLNIWDCPYHMRCDAVESEHLWLFWNGRWLRVMKASFSNLQYETLSGQWEPIGDQLWGFPGILTGNSERFYNVLAEPERYFKNEQELLMDWEAFVATPDPDFTEFCNDIFGNG